MSINGNAVDGAARPLYLYPTAYDASGVGAILNLVMAINATVVVAGGSDSGRTVLYIGSDDGVFLVSPDGGAFYVSPGGSQ